jgi:hypothetical protein
MLTARLVKLNPRSVSKRGSGIGEATILVAAHADADRLKVLSPAFQPGRDDNFTAFVLAAPGRREATAGRPAAGQTGTNIDAVLAHLHRFDPDAFPWLSRLDYRIVNTVSKVLHGKRSLPLVSEIREHANLERLKLQLGGYTTIVALSPKAVLACRAAGFEPTYCAVHPGNQGINPLITGFSGKSSEAVDLRIQLYAELLFRSRGRCDDAMADMAERRMKGLGRRGQS